MNFPQFRSAWALRSFGLVLGQAAILTAGQYELYNTDASAWGQATRLFGYEFAAEPLGSFDFGSGPIDVGNANLIFREQGSTIDVVALSLRRGNVVVTLQSERGLNPSDVLWGPGMASQGTRSPVPGTEFWDMTLDLYLDYRTSSRSGELIMPGFGDPDLLFFAQHVTLVSMDNQNFWLIPPWALVIPGVNRSSNFPRPFGLVRSDQGIDFNTVLNASLATAGTLTADLNRNGVVDAGDINLLVNSMSWGNNTFDLTNDAVVNQEDHLVWVEQLAMTYHGDANLDREFNSDDIVQVFQAGQYEDGIDFNSGWATGDWNGDREFDSDDMIIAQQSGSYEQGPRSAVITVPEPSGLLLLLTGGLTLVCLRAAPRNVYWRQEHEGHLYCRLRSPMCGLCTSRRVGGRPAVGNRMW